MTHILPTLRTVMGNILQNRDSIKATIAATEARGTTVSPDVQDAIDLLVKTFGPDVQKIGELIGAQLQVKQLKKTHEEVLALLAGLQVVMSKEELMNEAAAQHAANAETDSPLFIAVGTGGVSAADEAAHEEVAAPAQEAGHASVLEAANE